MRDHRDPGDPSGRRPARPSASAPPAARTGAGPNRQHPQQPTSRSNSDRNAQRRRESRPQGSSVERLMRIERRKARSRAFVYGIVVLAIMLIMTMMIIVVMQKTKPRPQFLFIQNGTLVHSVKSQALILRDDTVLTAPVSGTLQPLASEGTRVARGQKIALIIPTGLESQLSELNKCEQDIVDLQNELMNQGKGAGARAIFNESGVALSSIVNLVRADLANGSLANLPTYAASLSVVMDQRSSKLTSIDFHDARLDQLLVQRTTLEQSLGIASGTIYSDQPGIVSFNLDGYESALGVTAVESLSLNQIQDVQKQAGSHQPVEQLVTAGQPILRVTSSREQYLAFYLDGLNASQLDPDRTYSLDVPSDGTRIEGCRLVRTESDDQGTLVIFGTDRKVEWFADRRTFETELAIAETSGMKIPRVSLINFSPEQRRADIMLVNGGYTWQVPVVVTDYDREYAIIEALPEDQAVTGDAAILAAGESPDQTDASARTAALRPAVSTVIVANPESIAAGEFIGE